jgi:hypothetical protein
MYHYNGKAYEGTCECGFYFYAPTIREMKSLDDFHTCGVDVSMPKVDDYLIEFTPTAEFVKPMFTTSRF